MTLKLLTEHHLEFLSLKEGCTCSSESTHVKIPHCWKSHVTAHLMSQMVQYHLSDKYINIYIVSEFMLVHYNQRATVDNIIRRTSPQKSDLDAYFLKGKLGEFI